MITPYPALWNHTKDTKGIDRNEDFEPNTKFIVNLNVFLSMNNLCRIHLSACLKSISLLPWSKTRKASCEIMGMLEK